MIVLGSVPPNPVMTIQSYDREGYFAYYVTGNETGVQGGLVRKLVSVESKISLILYNL